MKAPKYLDQHCGLRSKAPVRYAKTKGGFWKLCDSCRAVVENADLLEEELQIYASSSV